jgi:hypothetical protein
VHKAARQHAGARGQASAPANACTQAACKPHARAQHTNAHTGAPGLGELCLQLGQLALGGLRRHAAALRVNLGIQQSTPQPRCVLLCCCSGLVCLLQRAHCLVALGQQLCGLQRAASSLQTITGSNSTHMNR